MKNQRSNFRPMHARYSTIRYDSPTRSSTLPIIPPIIPSEKRRPTSDETSRISRNSQFFGNKRSPGGNPEMDNCSGSRKADCSVTSVASQASIALSAINNNLSNLAFSLNSNECRQIEALHDVQKQKFLVKRNKGLPQPSLEAEIAMQLAMAETNGLNTELSNASINSLHHQHHHQQQDRQQQDRQQQQHDPKQDQKQHYRSQHYQQENHKQTEVVSNNRWHMQTESSGIISPREEGIKMISAREKGMEIISAREEGIEIISPREGIEIISPREGIEIISPREGTKMISPREKGMEIISPREGIEIISPREGEKMISPREKGMEIISPREGIEIISPREGEKLISSRENGMEIISPREGIEFISPRENGREIEPIEGNLIEMMSRAEEDCEVNKDARSLCSSVNFASQIDLSFLRISTRDRRRDGDNDQAAIDSVLNCNFVPGLKPLGQEASIYPDVLSQLKL